MRLTIRTNLAMRTLMFCAAHPERIVRKHEIAAACCASENHLAQVVNALGQMGFIQTLRGRAGGLRLARPAAEIRVGAVLRAFEGALPFAECFDPAAESCPLAPTCVLREALEHAIDAFYAATDRWTIADLVADDAVAAQFETRPEGPRVIPACASRPAATTAGIRAA